MLKILFIILCFVGFFIIEGLISLILELYGHYKTSKFYKNHPEISNLEDSLRNEIMDKKMDSWIEDYLIKDLETDIRKAFRFLGIFILFIIIRPILYRIIWIKYLNKIS